MGPTSSHRRTNSTRKRKRLRWAGLVAGPCAITLLVTCLALSPAPANASSSTTLDDVLGLTRQQFVESIEQNWSSSYEGTPYEGWYLNEQLYPSWYDGMWWPRGNPSPTGHVGMNCGGFVARAITDAGANDYNSSFMADWWNGAPNASDGLGAAAGHYANARTFWRLAKTYGLEMYEFADKWALLDSGLAVKGDIVVMIDDVDSGGFDDYGRYHAHVQDSHIGVFWGDENGYDKFRHASHDVSITAETTVSGCVESTLQPKCWGSRFYLIKFKDFGGITLSKQSALPDLSEGNASYSLEGAEYGVFSSREDAATHQAARAIETYRTDTSGSWGSGRVFEPGTYYIAETSAPSGFALDGSVYGVEVVAGSDTTIGGGAVVDVPQYEKPSTWALKHDAETADGSPQGAASLAGAEFEVCYYDGIYKTSALPSKATRTWTVKTGADGVARASDALKVSGDEFYRDDEGAIVLPIGTVTVRETKAPDGYRLSDSQLYVANIKSNGSAAQSVTPFAAPTVNDYVVRGGVAIGKIDRQNGTGTAQGSASLAGATFEIISENAHPIIVDGATYHKGDAIMSIVASSGDAGVVASTAADCLPFGEYSIREVETGTGYLFDADSRAWRATFDVKDDGTIVDLTSADVSAANLVVRGDFEFSKVDGADMTRLANIPFMLTSKTTGESHVVVTDENGMLSTASSWNAHTQNTNANDAAVSYQTASDESDATGAIDDELLDEPVFEAKTLSTMADDIAKGDDRAAAGSVASEGDEHADGEAEAQDDSRVQAGSETAAQTDSESQTDTETQDNSEPTLMVDESMLDPTAGVWFNGGTIISCDVDDDLGALPYDTYTVSELPVSANAGHELVSFDVTITRNARELDLGTVDDAVIPDEPEQPDEPTEPIPEPEPEIGTTLTSDGESHHAQTADTISLVDVVAYSGLTPGKQYLVEGTLHVRADDGADAGALVNITGEDVCAHATFVPEDSEGTAEVEFSFSATDLAGRTIVAFESLSCDGEVVATHEDINDEGQTVEFDKETPPEQPPAEPEKPVEPEQPTPETPTPQPEKPSPKPSVSKAQPSGTLPVLGDPVLTAGAIALALALLAAGMGVVSYSRSKKVIEVPTGACIEPDEIMMRQNPTCEPQARARRRTRHAPAHARRK